MRANLLQRGIKAYDAVLKGAAERGWPVKAVEGSCLKIVLCGESLELAVTEKTDPVPGVQGRPGERRQRRPAGSLVVTLASGYKGLSISDKRGTKIETKLPELFVKAEALAHELRTQKEEAAARQREYELESKRRREIEKRLERLNREVSAWQRAEQIRAYARALELSISKDASAESESDAARWLKWVRHHADNIDPTVEAFEIAPQEFWDWHLVTSDV